MKSEAGLMSQFYHLEARLEVYVIFTRKAHLGIQKKKKRKEKKGKFNKYKIQI